MSCFGLNVFDIALAARIFRIAGAAGLGQVAPLSCVDGNWKETMPHD